MLVIKGYRVRAEPEGVRLCKARWKGPPCAVDFVDEEVATPREEGAVAMFNRSRLWVHPGLPPRFMDYAAIVQMEFHKPST